MITNTKIHIDARKVQNEDGTFSVKLFRSSTLYSNEQVINTTPEKLFGEKKFATEQEADEEVQKMSNHFASTL